MQAYKIAKEHEATQKGVLPQATDWFIPHFTDFIRQLSDLWYHQNHLRDEIALVLDSQHQGHYDFKICQKTKS